MNNLAYICDSELLIHKIQVMNDNDKALIELETLKATLQNTLKSWNHKMKQAKQSLRFGMDIRFESAADVAPSDSAVKSVILTPSLEVGFIKIYSYKSTPEKQTKLLEYNNTFTPSQTVSGMSEMDYTIATTHLIKTVLVEAIGTYCAVLQQNAEANKVPNKKIIT